MTKTTRNALHGTLLLLVLPVVLIVLLSELFGVRVFDRIATILCINLVLVLGLQVFMGNSGILSFAHVGFMGIGAYTSAVLSMPLQMRGMALPELYTVINAIEMSPYLSVFVGGLVAAIVAAAVSYPLMRLSDAAAVITSFALLVVLHTIMVHWHQVTNGPRTLFGVQSATNLYLAAGVAVLMIAVALLFRESRTGILLRAARDDEVAAGAIGINISNMRWRGLVLSAFMAGIGGALWAHFITSFSPNAFYLHETFVILGMLVIGGAGTVSGAVLGTIAVSAAFELLRLTENSINLSGTLPFQLVGLTEIALAGAMIVVLILRPSGLIAAKELRLPDGWWHVLPGFRSTSSKLNMLADKEDPMNWKTDYRSFYYEGAPEPDDIVLQTSETALLVIDIQNTYMEPPKEPEELKRWSPFLDRMNNTVIPNTAALIETCRNRGIEVIFARIACLKTDGRDRSLSQKKPGWNYLLLPKDTEESKIVPELAAKGDEITLCKTTDSALTGTNLRLILHNMGIKNVIAAGIFTDQCVSSTVRSLADESFEVVVVEDCCAAATMELHNHELEIINMIYCHVASKEEVIGFISN